MWAACLARRRGNLARLAAGVERLAGGPQAARLEAGGTSLPVREVRGMTGLPICRLTACAGHAASTGALNRN